jgi:hypothetical protein
LVLFFKKEREKAFFFEKKKQQTFVRLVPGGLARRCVSR